MVKIILTIDDKNNTSKLEKFLKSNPSIKKIEYVKKKSKEAASLERGIKELNKALSGEIKTKSLKDFLNEN